MRSFTILCAMMAGLSGLYLYSTKHQTTLLDQQISQIVADTQHVREQTAMMRAEWALLNQPDRLASLSARFLPDMKPMAPTQFIQMTALADRLPAPGARPLPVANPRATISATIGATLAAAQPSATATLAAAQPSATATLAAARRPQAPAVEQPVRLAAYRPATGESAPAAHPDRPVMVAEAAPVAFHAAPIVPAAVTPVQHSSHAAPVSPDLTHNSARRAVLPVAPAARPVLPPAAAPAVRMAAYRPVRPVPMAVAAWRPAAPVPYQEARGYGRGSSLGFTHSASLPPPVPVSN
ncbi:putative inner-membrane translocator [Gluconacetobacter diazotrophicus PA1 5]|uniref:Putative inner-membrane translocator n=2 Tax=Gluconacetobacter diazotrophicus TaxID=33996 RepID=A9H0H2_GLUDA|nr:putative inner-membrane translocator [Gluconacetobacter diazotrophicus PA1 5]